MTNPAGRTRAGARRCIFSNNSLGLKGHLQALGGAVLVDLGRVKGYDVAVGIGHGRLVDGDRVLGGLAADMLCQDS